MISKYEMGKPIFSHKALALKGPPGFLGRKRAVKIDLSAFSPRTNGFRIFSFKNLRSISTRCRFEKSPLLYHWRTKICAKFEDATFFSSPVMYFGFFEEELFGGELLRAFEVLGIRASLGFLCEYLHLYPPNYDGISLTPKSSSTFFFFFPFDSAREGQQIRRRCHRLSDLSFCSSSGMLTFLIEAAF